MRTLIITAVVSSFVSFAGVYSSAMANFSTAPVLPVTVLECPDAEGLVLYQSPGMPIDLKALGLQWRKATGLALTKSQQAKIVKQFADAAQRQAREGLACAAVDEDTGLIGPTFYFDR